MNNIDSLIDFYEKNTNFDYRNGYIDYNFFDEGVKFYYEHAYSSNIDDGLDNFCSKYKKNWSFLEEVLNKEVKDLTEEELSSLKELKDFLECEIRTGNGFELLEREEVFYDCDNLSLKELEEQKEILESLIKEHNSYVENEKDYCFYIDKIEDKIKGYESQFLELEDFLEKTLSVKDSLDNEIGSYYYDKNSVTVKYVDLNNYSYCLDDFVQFEDFLEEEYGLVLDKDLTDYRNWDKDLYEKLEEFIGQFENCCFYEKIEEKSYSLSFDEATGKYFLSENIKKELSDDANSILEDNELTIKTDQEYDSKIEEIEKAVLSRDRSLSY